MAMIPERIKDSELVSKLLKAGFERIKQGKTRDIFLHPNSPDYILIWASDRVSIFDFVLPGEIYQKGEILTALTVFWLTQVIKKKIPHHLIAFGRGIDMFLSEELRKNPQLQARSLIAKKLKMIPIKGVVRNYLTGSAWEEYLETQKVGDANLPLGLKNGSKLGRSILNPTTKSNEGHNQPISSYEMYETLRQFGDGYVPRFIHNSLAANKIIADYAASRGFIFADTKFEFGVHNGLFMLADEVATPDSSCYWKKKDWKKMMPLDKLPSAFDKQAVRQWGEEIETPLGKGINKLSPEDSDHINFVHQQEVPENVCQETSRRNHNLLLGLTGRSLFEFQTETMGINVVDPTWSYPF